MRKALKSAILLIALVLTQTLTFAADAKVPRVYASQAPLSDLDCTQLLNSPWVWMLIVYAGIVFLVAFLSAQEKANHTAAH